VADEGIDQATADVERVVRDVLDEFAVGRAADESVEHLQARLLPRVADSDEGGQLSKGRGRRIAVSEAGAAHSLPGEARPAAKRWRVRDDARSLPARAHADDPDAPTALNVSCRCRLEYLQSEDAAPAASYESEVTTVEQPAQPSAGGEMAAAAGAPFTSGMIALVPAPEHAARLAVDGGLPADDLHLTLLFLGEADAISTKTRAALDDALSQLADDIRAAAPIPGRGFAINAFNPDGDETAIVLGVSGRDLPTVHERVTEAVTPLFELPDQHSPWVPHVTLTYSRDLSRVAELADRVGDIAFDRLRVSYAGQATDIPLTPPDGPGPQQQPGAARTWSTPGDAALAFEAEETGDGRIFAPGALTWTGGPWPLQYAPAMLSGHDGAELAGSIEHIARDATRITGAGVLYPTLEAGAEAIELLDAQAPLGVSVDLDDVTVEFVDRRPGTPTDTPTGEGENIVATAHLTHMSLLPLRDGAWAVTATRTTRLAAASGHNSRTTRAVEWTTHPGGATPWPLIAEPLGLATPATVSAAAGDPDQPGHGTVVHSESTGDVLMRITKGRVRGATLVAVPAYDRARIVIDPTDSTPTVPVPPRQEDMDLAAAAMGAVMRRVIAYVTTAPAPVKARQVAEALGITISQARDHLVRAAAAGRIVRLSPGLYAAAATLPEQGELSAAMSGDTDLPIDPDREREWDGDAAASRVLAWATGEGSEVDAGRLGQAFLWRDPDTDPTTLAAYKLGHADVLDGKLRIVPGAVFTIAGVLEGSMGGVDIPEAEREELRGRVEELYERLAEELDDPTIRPPWDEDEETAATRDIEASAWTAMRDTDPMPAAWFKEPTIEELPPGSGGVHYQGGRVYGWVAQAGEPHAGYPGRNLTIDSLGDIDLSHFLRARFTLDDGSVVHVGAFTMNVPHSKDGAECDTASCQFDDSRTVAAIVTVGMNSRGMWFSGAAAPWLSAWDSQVFLACQPSYHMRQGRDGRWQLRAVLSVPVPGHSSPLTLAASAHQAAAALVHRSNVALAASAAARISGAVTATALVASTAASGAGPVVASACACDTTPPALTPIRPGTAPPTDPDDLAASLANALLSDRAFIDGLTAAVARRDAENQARVAQLRARVLRTAPTPDPDDIAVAA